MKLRVTLSLDTDVLAKLKRDAVTRQQSLSNYVAGLISSRADADQVYERCMRRALASMEIGFDLGGGPYLTREQAHARR